MRYRWLGVAAALLSSGCSNELPPAPQVLLYITTDAPLPAPLGVVPDELAPVPLFDTLRFDVYAAGSDTPCDGCSRVFAVDEALVAQNEASIGVPASTPLNEQRVRIRLYLAAAELGDEPSQAGSIDAFVRLPALEADEVQPLHVLLPTDAVGSPLGSLATPIDPLPGLPEPTVVGSWPGAMRVPCADEPQAGEVCVPGGAFWMGDASQVLPDDPLTRADERRIVVLSPFFVDAREVTVAEMVQRETYTPYDPKQDESPYVGFEADTFCTFPQDAALLTDAIASLPTACISFFGAGSHCAARGATLPTEAQLEYLMSGLRGARFPWGDDVPDCADAAFARFPSDPNGSQKCAAHADAGAAESGSGELDQLVLPGGTVFDLAGNLREWTRDRFEPQDSACWTTGVSEDPTCPPEDDADRMAVRGGSWAETPLLAHAARRAHAAPDAQLGTIGFRCVRDATGTLPTPALPALPSWSRVSSFVPRAVSLASTCSEPLDPACVQLAVAGKQPWADDPSVDQPHAQLLNVTDGAIVAEHGLIASGGGEALAVAAFGGHGPAGESTGLLVAGHFAGTLSVAGVPGEKVSAGGLDGFTSHFADGLAQVWTQGGAADDSATAVPVADAQLFGSDPGPGPSAAWSFGTVVGDATFFDAPSAAAGIEDAFLLAAVPTSGPLPDDDFFLRRLGAPGARVRPTAAARLAFGAFAAPGIAVAGSVEGAVDLGFGAVTQGVDEDAFLLALPADVAPGSEPPGAALILGGSGTQRIEAMASYRGGVVAVGSFTGVLEVLIDDDVVSFASAGGRDAFVLFADMGTTVWDENGLGWQAGAGIRSVRVISGPGDQIASGVAVNDPGHIVVAGSFEETATLEPLAPIVSAGGSDVFVLGLMTSALTPRQLLVGGSAGTQRPTGIAISDAGTAVIVGEMENTLNLGDELLDAASITTTQPLAGFVVALDMRP